MSKPLLPPRNRGVQQPATLPTLPARPPALPKRIPAQPTEPLRPISNKPILPPRVSLGQNGPSLPSRNKTAVVVQDQKVCGRQRPPKYEDRDFETVDAYVRSLPDYGSTAELSNALTCNFPDTVDKYRAIFTWIALNIAYDADSFLNNRVPPQSAQNTFQTKLAVCAGYSQLFQQLCDSSKLRCIEINGYGKGYGFSPDKPLVKGSNHAWNAVFVEDEWRMIESTWGAGYLGDGRHHFKFNSFYFLTDPEEFIYRHMPMDDDKQFTAARFTWEQFFALNNVDSLFFTKGVQQLNHIDCGSVLRPVQGQEIEVEMLIPDTLDTMLQFDIGGRPAPHHLTRQTCEKPGFYKITGTFRVDNLGAANLHVFAKDKTEQQIKTYSPIIKFYVVITPHPTGTVVPMPGFPTTYSHLGPYNLLQPLEAPLQPRVTYTFVVQDCAEDAASITRNLVLFQSQAGPPLRKKTQGGRVTYEVAHHIVKTGEIWVAQRQGNSFSPIAIWQV